MEVTPNILRRVQMDNIQTNQISGETSADALRDGWPNEVAHDVGYMATSDVVELIHDIETDSAETTVSTIARKLRPTTGKLRGDSEPDGGITPAGHEPYKPLTESEKEVGKIGVARAKRAFEQAKRIAGEK